MIVGENNIGKSNFLAALALIFSPDTSNSSRQLQIEDIWNGWKQLNTLPTVLIQVTLTGFTTVKEKALVAKWLINSPDELKARITYEYRPIIQMDDIPNELSTENYEWTIYGGEKERERIDYRDLGQIRLELLPALRDAQRELSRGGQRRFGRLISRFKTDDFENGIDRSKFDVERAVKVMNRRLERAQPVASAQTQLNQRLSQISGPTNTQEATFTPSDLGFDDLVKNLQVYIGNSTQVPQSVEFNGLGYNNLLYIGALLTDFYRRREITNLQSSITLPLVAIEEPEAHLHPHLQKFLNRYFATNDDGQVIVTTHSTHITSSVSPEHIVVLYHSEQGITATNIGKLFSSAAPEQRYLRSLQRYLDATKSTMFFANKVLLVEGISEAILLPVIAKKCYDIDLNDKGVSVVSIQGTGFATFLQLFGPNALKIKCAVLTDSDPPKSENPTQNYDPEKDHFPLTTADPEYQPDISVINLQTTMEQEKQGFVRVFYNLKTLEHDIAIINDRVLIQQSLEIARQISTKITQPQVDETMAQPDLKNFSKALLRTVSGSKGAFAQALAEKLSEDETRFMVPQYIQDAFTFLGLITPEP